MVSWQTESGTAEGYLALPAGEQGPGVLVLHAWWGLTDFFKGLCDQLAREGFVVLAPDLFEGATAETVAEAEELVESNEGELTSEVVQSGARFLRNHPAVQGERIGVVGFSFGAAWAIALAGTYQPGNIGAVVLFYGNYPGYTAEDFAQTPAAFLGHFAENDPYEEREYVEQTLAELYKAGREATFHFYPGTGHWFYENNQPAAYDPQAAQLAWERTLAFLQEHL